MTHFTRLMEFEVFVCWNIRLVIWLCVITRGALLLPLLPFRGKLSIVSDVLFLHFWILLRGQQAGQFINLLCNQTLHQSFSSLCSDVTWIYFLTTRDILDPIWKPWDLKFYFFLFAISGHHLEQEFLTVYADAMARCFWEQLFPRIFLSLTKRGG